MAQSLARVARLSHRSGFGLCVASACAALLMACAHAPEPAYDAMRPGPLPENHTVRYYSVHSDLLSRFWGRDMRVEAGVVVPPDWRPDERSPIVYYIHGFGGSHHAARNLNGAVTPKLRLPGSDYPRLIHVCMNAQFPLGHHVFADSVNNGPWNRAFVEEFLPSFEAAYGGLREASQRYLSGHSSGGWSALWLQVSHPDLFGGVWASAPDPVDFRDFTGVNIYTFANAYTTPSGRPVMLLRDGSRWARSLREVVMDEERSYLYGGQFRSFEAVFSPRGEDGRPMPLFDRQTGAIDRQVAEAWKRYDISLILRDRWRELGPQLQGKVHVVCGDRDTFRLEGPLRLLQQELTRLSSDAEIVFVPGADHFNLSAPNDFWPHGLYEYIHRAVAAKASAVPAPTVETAYASPAARASEALR